MKHRHKDIERSRRAFEIEVSSETAKKKYNEIYEHIKKEAHVPGYRPGNAPRDLLEKIHGQKIKEETIHDLVLDSYRFAVRESDTNVFGMPEVSDLKFDLEKGLSFRVTVDIRPRVNLKRYKGLPVTTHKAEVKSEDVDRYLSILRESCARFSDITDRGVKMEDYVVCDLECMVDGKLIHPKRKGVWIFVDKSNPMPGLVEGLIGQGIGETREINLTLPHDFQDAMYRDKQALFKISLTNIKEKYLAELNDEFAKGLGSYKSLEELKKAIESDLTRKLENRAREDMEEEVLKTLLKETDFELPDNLVKNETKRLIELRKKELAREGDTGGGRSGKEQKPREEELQREAEKQALRNVKTYFILDEIARREGISVSDEELEKLVEALAVEYGKTKDEAERHYKKGNIREGLRDKLKENKVIEFLISNAKMKDD